MSEHLSTTAHGDAPLTAALAPDARATSLQSARDGDELIGRTVTINRPMDELFGSWRELSTLPRVLGDGSVNPDELLIEEIPGQAILWRSAPDTERRVSGRVDFRPAPAGRGTEVTISIASEPRGLISTALDKLTQQDPNIVARRVLRRFKQLMETGEISTAEPPRAAPRA